MAVTVEPSSSASAEEDLAVLAGKGNSAAIEQLISRIRSRVRGWANRFTGDADTADDVAQVVMIGLRDRVGRYDHGRPFATWLYVITRRAALSAVALIPGAVPFLESLVLDQAGESRGSDADAAQGRAVSIRRMQDTVDVVFHQPMTNE